MKNEKKNTARFSFKLAAIAITAVIVVNLCLCLIPVNIRTVDITKNDAYTPSDEADTVFNSLDEKISVYVINANGLDTRYEYFFEIIDTYENIDIKWSKYEDIADKASAIGITEKTAESLGPYWVIVESGTRTTYYDYYNLLRMANTNTTLVTYIQAMNSSLGASYAEISNGKAEMTLSQFVQVSNQLYNDASQRPEYSSAYQTMMDTLINDSQLYFYGENMLCRAIEYVTVETIPARYLLTGHGEADFSKTILGLLMFPQLGLNYKPLDISAGANIPNDAVDIIIASPESDITDAEAEKLTAYVERGGVLTLFTDGDCDNMPKLMALMNDYGMTLVNGTVIEKTEKKADTESDSESTSDASAQSDVVGPVPEGSVYEYTDEISVSINTDHKGLAALKNNSQIAPVIVKGNEIKYKNISDKKITATPLLTTSDKCFVGENEAELLPRALAVISEKEGGGKVLWYTGAASFLKEFSESMTDEEQKRIVNNAMVVSSTSGLAPFTYTSTIVPPAGKLHADKLMTVTDAAYLWSVLLPVILVVIASVIGAILVYKRKKA